MLSGEETINYETCYKYLGCFDKTEAIENKLDINKPAEKIVIQK